MTSTRTGLLGIPKGMIEAHLGPLASAIAEAWEEAGVRGVTGPRPIGAYTYEKYGRAHHVVVFAMDVTEILDDWPERDERERTWVPLRTAGGRVGDPELALLLHQLANIDLAPAVHSTLTVSWVPPEIWRSRGRIGLCSLPGERTRSRDADLRALQAAGTTHLVCLVEADELSRLEPPESVRERTRAAESAGLSFLHLPIEDFAAPDDTQVETLLTFVDEATAADGTVVLHCWAGLGRSGTLLACVFVHRGMNAADAITTTRWVRPGAIQSEAQESAIEAMARRR